MKKSIPLACLCLLFSCSPLVNKFAFFPDKVNTLAGIQMPDSIKRVNVRTKDGKVLTCLYLPTKDSPNLLIYFHGNAGNIDQRLGELVNIEKLGINVLGVEYRGYGNSTGRPSERGIYRDGEAAMRYGQDTLGFPVERIVVCGRSIGTTVASYLAQDRKLKGLILITPLTTGRDLADINGLGIFKPLICDPFNVLRMSKKNKAPILILHGTEDEVVPYKLGKRVFETVAGTKRMVTIEGGHHNDLEFIDSVSYWSSIKEIIR